MNELYDILVDLRHQILHEEKTAGVIDDVRAEQAMFKDSVLGITKHFQINSIKKE
jgi:hypothetical protein